MQREEWMTQPMARMGLTATQQKEQEAEEARKEAERKKVCVGVCLGV